MTLKQRSRIVQFYYKRKYNQQILQKYHELKGLYKILIFFNNMYKYLITSSYYNQ
ncbi:hypothetical protein pb186bvf_018409 [Paramecium bursaria]